MKWQYTYGPTLLPWNNHFHTSKACLSNCSSHTWDKQLVTHKVPPDIDLWLWMYGNGYSMPIVLDHRSTATSLTGNRAIITGLWTDRVKGRKFDIWYSGQASKLVNNSVHFGEYKIFLFSKVYGIVDKFWGLARISNNKYQIFFTAVTVSGLSNENQTL